VNLESAVTDHRGYPGRAQNVRDLERAGAEALHLEGSLSVVGDGRSELIAHDEYRRGAEQQRDRPGDEDAPQVALPAEQRRIEEERESLDRDPDREQGRPGRRAGPVSGEHGCEHEEGGREVEPVERQRPLVDQRPAQDHVGEDHQPGAVDAQRPEHPLRTPGKRERDQDDHREVEGEHLPHESVDEVLGALPEVDRRDQHRDRERRVLDVLVAIREVSAFDRLRLRGEVVDEDGRPVPDRRDEDGEM
jgi:hypothetical protein